MNGRFDTSVESYEKCLALRTQLHGAATREVADVHWCLAFALESTRAGREPNAFEMPCGVACF